jgi:hypothetical protein
VGSKTHNILLVSVIGFIISIFGNSILKFSSKVSFYLVEMDTGTDPDPPKDADPTGFGSTALVTVR